MPIVKYFGVLLLLIYCIAIGYGRQGKGDISLITAAPGADMYSYFGHTAIKVKGSKSSEDIIYNYGTFDFDQPNFYTNFLKGKLLYSLSKQSYPRLLQSYHYEQRSVYEQPLNLSETQRQQLLQALEENYKPENRAYLYEFFFDNCSTRSRDLFDATYSGIAYQSNYTPLTFRELLEEHTCHYPLVDFGIDLIIGSRADRIASREEQMFLPKYVHDHLNEALSNGESVVKEDYLVLDFRDVENLRSSPTIDYVTLFFFALLLVEIVLMLMQQNTKPRWLKVYDSMWYSILGVGSIVLLVMWLGTDHYATKANYNVTWMSPFYFLLFSRYRRQVGYVIIGLLCLTGLISVLGLQQYHWAVLPISCLTALKITRLLKRVDTEQSHT